jgi:CspA family cold shock protein
MKAVTPALWILLGATIGSALSYLIAPETVFWSSVGIAIIGVITFPRPLQPPKPLPDLPKPPRCRGRVKWYNEVKGYGFITPFDNSRDVFLHVSAVERSGIQYLGEGDIVDYDLINQRGKLSADNLVRVGRA